MFRKATPEEVGISSHSVLRFIKTLESYKLKTHSLILARGDKVFAEGYYAPFTADTLHRQYSASKSFVTLAIGLAAQEGLLSLDDRVMAYFPEYRAADGAERFAEMTVRDMLCMRTCMVDYSPWWGTDDRAAAYFGKPSRQIPATNFHYDSAGAFMLGCLVEKVTGKPLLDYIKEKCLSRLGFSSASYCLLAPGGYAHSDSGVMCTARDLLIFARLLMCKGEIDGEQLVDRAFMEAAIKKQVPTDGKDIVASYGTHGYGYLIWKLPRDGFGLFGMADQYAICDPKTDLIFVLNSENMDCPSSRALILHAFYDTIVADIGESPLPADDDAATQLAEHLSSLTLVHLQGRAPSARAKDVDGATYALEPNAMGLESITLRFHGDKGELIYRKADGEHTLAFGMGHNVLGKFPEHTRIGLTASVYEDGAYDCAVSAEWSAPDTLHVLAQIIDTYLGTLSISLSFKDDRVSVAMHKHAQYILDGYSGFAVGARV